MINDPLFRDWVREGYMVVDDGAPLWTDKARKHLPDSVQETAPDLR